MQPYVIFDIDNTLADISHRLHYLQSKKKDWNSFYEAMINDKPILEIFEVLNALINSSCYAVVFSTGRPEKYRDQTLCWLSRYLTDNFCITGQELYMRKSGDYRPDYVVKEELLDQIIDDNAGILPSLVFEDRQQVVDMYRQQGIRVMQVADGKY